MFEFLFDKHLGTKWLAAIKRQNFVDGKLEEFIPGKSHRVCQLHFAEDCFTSTAQRKRLKPGSVPTIFPSYPSYLNDKGEWKIYPSRFFVKNYFAIGQQSI